MLCIFNQNKQIHEETMPMQNVIQQLLTRNVFKKDKRRWNKKGKKIIQG